MTVKGIDRRGSLGSADCPIGQRTVKKTGVEVIETIAGEVAAELAREV